jgi:hypothetical protein
VCLSKNGLKARRVVPTPSPKRSTLVLVHCARLRRRNKAQLPPHKVLFVGLLEVPYGIRDSGVKSTSIQGAAACDLGALVRVRNAVASLCNASRTSLCYQSQK